MGVPRAVWRSVPLAATLVLAWGVRPAHAQQPTAFGSVLGIVDDSVRRGRLGGAAVTVEGSTRRTVTDPRGLFLLDSIPPGDYKIIVRHPLLDTIGVAEITEVVRVSAGQRSTVALYTPTIASLRERTCVRGGAMNGPAMVFGRVSNADTDAPIAGASLSLAYQDPNAGDVRDRLRQTRSREDGSFAICGLPDLITGTVQAVFGGQTTAEVPVAVTHDLLGTALLTFGSPTERAATLTGRVINRAGEPVQGAQVAIEGGTEVATTGADGAFSLAGLPSGTRAAVVRKLGLAPVTQVVALTKREPRRITVVLGAMQLLAAVRINEKLEGGLQRTGFLDRQKGASGHFITPDDIDRRKPEVFTDLIQTLNGFRVVMTPQGNYIEPTRMAGSAGACLNVVIDRIPFEVMQPGDLDAALRNNDVGAVEAYSSSTNVPAEFQRPGKACPTIVVWTKVRLARP